MPGDASSYSLISQQQDRLRNQTTDKEIQYENFLRAALASMEMRNERGFNLEVPLAWVKSVHLALYGENAEAVMEHRIRWARYRKERRELEDA